MDIQGQILEKQREMKALQHQMKALNQKHLEGLYPGRCFQYCIDHGLGRQDELAVLSESVVRELAEHAHFSKTAAKSPWPCGNSECQGWDSVADTCPCGAKRFYWVYEETLSLVDSALTHAPAASAIEE